MEEIAIIGMACLFPGAKDLGAYWRNIVSKVDAVADPPPDWEAERYFDPERQSNDRVYCKRGGYLGDLARFDPLEFGVMPSSLDGGEPDHFLALKIAGDALADAGYSEKSVDSERTSVIVGRGTYINRGVTNSFQHTVVVEQTLDILRGLHPDYDEKHLQRIKEKLKEQLPPFNAETVPSLVPNVLTGRIANRLNLMGTNYLVDAACASSLIAVEHGMRELAAGQCDLALIGGVNASIPPTMLVIFSQINALSRRRQLRPFDEQSDGTMLGEGVGFVVLKRKADAERDGNRIYAVLRAVGVASDGRALGLLAPRLEGEALAIRRAYDRAGVSPRTVGLIEAHGTGTPVGDVTEVAALKTVFGGRRGELPDCAFGTVKSMIAHLIPASGMAGLIKTALALYHKVLPPTLCDTPNPNLGLGETPFYLNTETRPWIHGSGAAPRRAGVNAFGFGGINAHAVLEEHTGPAAAPFESLQGAWESEVFLFRGASREELLRDMETTRSFLSAAPDVDLKDLAFTLNTREGAALRRLAIVAGSVDDLSKKLAHAAERLSDPATKRLRDRSGIFYFDDPLGTKGGVAFLFPGEGAQYTDMLADLCMHFPEARAVFDVVDSAFVDHRRGHLPSHTVFPLPLGQGGAERLWSMDSAAESVFTANQALLELMKGLKLRPDAMIGHSTGEYSALLASGMVDAETRERFVEFVAGVNTVYEKTAAQGLIAEGVLLSVGAAQRHVIESLVEQSGGELHIAMDNCPNQVVLCGRGAAVEAAEKALRETGAMIERLPFDRAYHTRWFEAICRPLLDYFETLEVRSPRVKTYSCVSALPYPDDAAEIRGLATSQWARRVCFREAIEAMYDDGVRIFVEVGPRGNLTAFVDDILRKRSYLAVPVNLHRRSGITQLNTLVGLLTGHHVPLDASFLYRYRKPRALDLGAAGSAKARKTVKIPLALPRLHGADLSALRVLPQHSGNGKKTAEAAEVGAPRAAAATAAGAAALPGDPRTSIMMAHLKTMEHFIAAQQEVYQAFLSKRSSGGSVHAEGQRLSAAPALQESLPAQPQRPLPFISEVVSHEPGERAVALCRLDFNEAPFLLDHTLGRNVSELDSGISGLAVVPLTFSMEIMAEGAALLMGDKKLIGMREIRGYRWIGLDEGRTTLRITAARDTQAGGEVKVELREESGTPEDSRRGLPIAEGTMLFGDRYPDPPPAAALDLLNERDSAWKGKDLYNGFMFHGPSLQGVASMERSGDNGVGGVLRATAEEALLASSPRPDFLSDPVVLDAAGQAVAYWTSDYLEKAFHIFPFRLEALHIYGPRFTVPEHAPCRTWIRLVEEGMVRSDIDIVDPQGRLRMRLLGWWDRRFDQPEPFYALRRSPKQGMASAELKLDPALCGSMERTEQFSCALLDGVPSDFLLAHDRIWMRVLAHLALSRKERRQWRDMKGPEKRRLDWLLGRAAVKDAVRMFLRKRDGIELCPADIEVAVDQAGKPYIESAGPAARPLPAVSLAHSSGIAVAVADTVAGEGGIGIDCERLRELGEDFDGVAFSDEERALLPRADGSADTAWRLRLWCAKEAVAKALGCGLQGTPRNLVVKSLDSLTGAMEVTVDGALKSTAPALEGRTVTAHSMIHNGVIIAISTIRGDHGREA